MSANDLAIDVSDLWVSFDKVQVLRGVNFKVKRGQVVALIGPNGSGKTTLLRSILGLQKFNRGKVRLLGEDDLSLVLPRIGYVPQRLNLERGFILSVREFLSLRLPTSRHWFWRSRSSLDAEFGSLPEEMDIAKLMDRPVAALSGGQLQRVLIAFSLLPKPELLFLDEPTAGVDTPGEASFYDLIAAVHKKLGLTVVLVSHDLSMVYRHATWVYALNGVVCCEGPPEEVMNAESLREAYGIHVSPYHHHHGHDHSHHHHAH